MATMTIDRPGVEVVQEFRTTSPNIITPTLPASILGRANQVVEAIDDTGAFVSSSLLASPARLTTTFLSTPFQYAVGGEDLVISVRNGAAQTITFSTGPNLTATEVADEINTQAIPGILAEVETSGTQQRVVIRTTSTGENATLQVLPATTATALSEFGLLAGYKDRGGSGYTNHYHFDILRADYPDPRSNIDELDIDYSTVRLFMNDGAGNQVEASTASTFLQGDTSAVTVADDSDGDNVSPFLEFAGATFVDQAGAITSTVDWSGLTYPGDFGTNVLSFLVDYSTQIDVTFANPADETAALLAINTALGVNGTATYDGSGNLVITSASVGGGSMVQILGSSTVTLATLGLTANQLGLGSPSGVHAVGNVDLTGVSYAANVQGRRLVMSINGDEPQELIMSSSVVDGTTLRDEIRALWGADVCTVVGGVLVLSSSITGASNGGVEASIRIDKGQSDATLLSSIGLTSAGAPFNSVDVIYGNPFSPAVGDDVWVDGIRIGEITEIPVSPTNRLRLDVESLLAFTGTTWTIIANGLSSDYSTATRPSSDLIVDENSGTLVAKAGLFRESDGTVTLAGPLATYLAYNALRLDVSAAAENASLLRYGGSTDLEAALSPLDTQNPLGLGMWLALQNAPGIEVTGLGVSDATASEPEGTLTAYSEAFEYLESKDVYAITALTHAFSVAQIGQAHVDTMSTPGNDYERYLIYNPSRPTRKTDTLVASAATANVAGPPTDVIDSGIANLQTLLAAAGVTGPTYTESDGIYVEFENDTNKYLVQSVSGGQITINNGPLSSSNDAFYDNSGSPVFTSVIVDRPLTVKILGATLANLTEEAVAYGEIPQAFANRRVVVTAPDKAVVTIDGLDTVVEGYYLNAALAGRVSAVLPQQGLTEDTLAGVKQVLGSNDRYGELQLKIMNGGGLWVFYQDGASVRTRMQVTSDMSSAEKREDSIRRILDFTAKTVRATLRSFIGGVNITTNVMDAVNSTLEGLGQLLIKLGVITAWNLLGLRQDADDPTLLEVDVELGVPYPLNKIRVTLIV